MQHTDGVTEVLAEVTEYDHCAGQVLLEHFGFTDAVALSIAGDLTSASVTGTIPMMDALDESHPATDPLVRDLTWTATGRRYRDNILYDNGHQDGITLINHDHEVCRDAAVAGGPAGAETDARVCRQIGGSLFLFIE